MSATQIVSMHPRHREALANGTKRSTVRWAEDIRPGPALFVFDPAIYAPLPGNVQKVTERLAFQLTAADVYADTNTDMTTFVEELRSNYYPDMPDNPLLQVVTFTLER